jgi:hypothetical protein
MTKKDISAASGQPYCQAIDTYAKIKTSKMKTRAKQFIALVLLLFLVISAQAN